MRKDENHSAIFAAFHKTFRALQGDMPLSDFAKKLGMSQALVRTYLDGTRFPDFQALQKISELFGVSVDWLLGRSDFRVEENANITAKEMGLRENAALLLRDAHSAGSQEERLYPQFVSSLVENRHFTRFAQQIRLYKKRVEETEKNLKGAPPSMRDFYSYRLNAEKAAVTDVFHDLLDDMVPPPEFKNTGNR